VKPKVVIQNVVATARLKHRVDLNAIVRAFPEVEYRPGTFPGLPFKLDRPKSCTLIFSSGSMVCTGTKSEKVARRAVMKVVRELRKAGIIVASRPEITVQNIVASVELGGVTIDLEDAVYKLRAMYEPDMFPGAIYRMDDPKCVFLIFGTGKLVCVGTKREEDVYRAVENLVATLEEMGVLIKKA